MSVFQHQNIQNVQQQMAGQPQTASPLDLRDPQSQQVTQPARNPRKRKSPPTQQDPAQPAPPPPPGHSQPQQPQQQQPPPQMHHVLPPLMHIPPGAMPPYQYDYTPGGMPPAPPPEPQSPDNSAANRPLSTSKRAEQNRKAQRAFRERRDQHVKALESRSQLLDAALASADEANRRWEECRALVDQLRVENTALRAALAQSQGHVQIMTPGGVLQSSEEHKKEHEEERKE